MVAAQPAGEASFFFNISCGASPQGIASLCPRRYKPPYTHLARSIFYGCCATSGGDFVFFHACFRGLRHIKDASLPWDRVVCKTGSISSEYLHSSPKPLYPAFRTPAPLGVGRGALSEASRHQKKRLARRLGLRTREKGSRSIDFLPTVQTGGFP
jgi:hypothetical protein